MRLSNRVRLACAIVSTLACAACGDTQSQNSSDRRTCLNGDTEPAEGIRSCSRLLQAKDRKLMPEVEVLYHRASAFEAMDEYAHAKLDYQRVLALNPDHQLAKERLEQLQ
jgi:lipoprotein NlpI